MSEHAFNVDAAATRLLEELRPFEALSDSIAEYRITDAIREAFEAGERKAEQFYEGALRLAQDRAQAAEADRDEYDRQRRLYHADMMTVREQRDAALAELAKLRDARVERSKEWWMTKARAEADTPIAAGVPDDSRCLVCGYDEESHKFVCACEKFTPPPVAPGRCGACLGEGVVQKYRRGVGPLYLPCPDCAATDTGAGELCVSVEDRVAKIDRWWGDYMVRMAERASPGPFPPGALKPEWEGDPAHAQTVAATDKQIDGFNESADPVEWVVYFTNPQTGARAQMFAVLRPYPEVHPAPREIPGEIERLTKAKDGAYAERNQVVALLARMALSLGWRAGLLGHEPDPDPTWDDDWKNVVAIDLPTGQVTWHYHDSDRPLFSSLPPYTGSWDGHDTLKKYRRVRAASRDPNTAQSERQTPHATEAPPARDFMKSSETPATTDKSP